MAAVPPKKYDDAVQPLLADQFPFGADCPIDRDIQAILFHYDVCQDDAAVLVGEELYKRNDYFFGDPEGSETQQQMFDDIAVQIPKSLRRCRISMAFSRILRDDPFAAVVSTSSNKRKADDVDDDNNDDDDKVSPVFSSSSDSKKVKNGADEDVEDIDDGDDDLDTLFNEVKSEV